MKLDDLKENWQQHVAPSSDTKEVMNMISELAEQASEVDKHVKRRDWIEISIALLLIPVWIYGAFNAVSHLQLIGFIVAIFACFYIPYKLVQAKKTVPPKDDSVVSFLLREQSKVKQQKRLLETVVWWYITPLTSAILLITLGASLNEQGTIVITDFLTIYYCLVVVLIIGAYFINKRAAKKKFAPLLEQIEKRLSELQQ